MPQRFLRLRGEDSFGIGQKLSGCWDRSIVELARATGSVDYRAFELTDQTLCRVPGAKILRFESALAFFNVSALTSR